MLHPSILPSNCWVKHIENFKAADGQIFQTSLIIKAPIGVQIFSNCVIWSKIISWELPDKDLLIGFDLLALSKRLQITAAGVSYKKQFKPYTKILRLYKFSETTPSYQHYIKKFLPFCLESHIDFSYSNPLWKNTQFFIKLPFKLNEDVNPTKATHPRMSPTELKLAQQECSDLLQQGLIEPTKLDWACQAFYVEKQFKIIRKRRDLSLITNP